MKPWIYLFIGAIGLAGMLTWQMIGLKQIRCDVCISYRNQELCESALGATPEDAGLEAMRLICAKNSSGVTEVLACQRSTVIKNVCRPKD